jgi:SAM-dependent methyltransferase
MSEAPNTYAQTEDFEFAALHEARNYRHAMLRNFSGVLTGHILEVGAGVGQMTGELLQQESISRLVSVEPDPVFFSRLRAAYPGHEIIQGTVEDVPSGGAWDAVLSVNVLEHIKDDGRELQNYSHLLGPKHGHLCLFVPARPEIYAPIDRDFGHFRRYTRRELEEKLSAAGFQPIKLRYYNLPGYFAWWLTFRVMKKRGFNAGAVRFFDRAIFPLVHGFESHVCPPPFGQSLMAVARAK